MLKLSAKHIKSKDTTFFFFLKLYPHLKIHFRRMKKLLMIHYQDHYSLPETHQTFSKIHSNLDQVETGKEL